MGHYGLTGMRERAVLLDAALEVRSLPGKGTTIVLQVRDHPAANMAGSQRRLWGPVAVVGRGRAVP